MTAATLRADVLPAAAPLDDADIHARAWAMVENVCDSVPDRLVLLHAAAMLTASLAHNQPDPIAVCEEMLAEHSISTMGILRDALALGDHTTPIERKS